jgi:hypothetical protein
MSASLAASTETPGNTAPEASLTMPAIDPWAKARLGRRHADTSAASLDNRHIIIDSLATT